MIDGKGTKAVHMCVCLWNWRENKYSIEPQPLLLLLIEKAKLYIDWNIK